ncbi:coiled-coil domain-containing protein 191 isoform X2 [Galleria mellonella]|uniref:Coiled-coil domain-containing protein 191 isoform X2 n=1 Tax=Galleria mellonella TaxID=7137 RepID=A0ABM3MXB8_GALME|nr:coiled-coil domain-containing protein 191 isoform X2 [Galleria mellonella]
MYKVKTTHNHGIMKNINWQRKEMRNSKDNRVNKEITKIRNDFQCSNLKNQIMLKDAIKSVDSLGNNGYRFNNRLLINDLNEITDSCFSETLEDSGKLILCNDVDFKIYSNPKMVEKENRKCKTQNMKPFHEESNSNLNNHITNNSDNEDINIMRVDCTYPSKSLKNTEISDCDVNSVLQTNNLITEESSNMIENIKEPTNNLQTTLIMMAISSKSNENDIHENSTNVAEPLNYEELTTRNIQQNTTVVNNKVYCKEIPNFLKVTAFKVVISDKQLSILRKYIKKWRDYVCNRKEHYSQQRLQTLNNFFDKLSRRKDTNNSSESISKSKQLVRDYSSYQHRYKIQKHIIALQKVKLEEQNRLIEELKYNKIVEASRQSVDAMREEVRKTYYEIDRQLKPKIKCLTNELKIHEIEEPSLVLHCLKVPQFLQRMEKRAREREEKHAIIRERRRQMEEERIRLKQQAELAKVEMDKEEKMKRIKELRLKRKREKIDGIRRKQYAEKMRALAVMADLHYEKNLLIKYGVRPFKILLSIKRDNIERAKAHYTFQLKKNVFLHFMWYTEDMWFERNYKAEDFYRKKILKKAFNSWKLAYRTFVIKKQVAEDYYDLYVTQLVFRNFCKGIEIIKKEQELKLQKAIIYHNSNLMFKIFTCWRTLPALNALKREQEARKARWREKVLLVVPDYKPPED